MKSGVLRSTALALFAAVITTACTAQPRVRPVRMGDVDTGTGTLEDVRRQFMGRWNLVSYDVYQGGKPVRLDATATMSYDDFGNVEMRGELKNPQQSADPNRSAKPALLNTSGRAVLDVRKQELYLQEIDQNGAPIPSAIAGQVDMSRVRRYEFKLNTLVLTITGQEGTPSAVSTWNKQP